MNHVLGNRANQSYVYPLTLMDYYYINSTGNNNNNNNIWKSLKAMRGKFRGVVVNVNVKIVDLYWQKVSRAEKWPYVSRILKSRSDQDPYSLTPRWDREAELIWTFKGYPKSIKQNLDKLGQQMENDKEVCSLPQCLLWRNFPMRNFNSLFSAVHGNGVRFTLH